MPTKIKYTLRLPPALTTRVENEARRQGISVNAWITRCLDRAAPVPARAPRPPTMTILTEPMRGRIRGHYDAKLNREILIFGEDCGTLLVALRKKPKKRFWVSRRAVDVYREPSLSCPDRDAPPTQEEWKRCMAVLAHCRDNYPLGMPRAFYQSYMEILQRKGLVTLSPNALWFLTTAGRRRLIPRDPGLGERGSISLSQSGEPGYVNLGDPTTRAVPLGEVPFPHPTYRGSLRTGLRKASFYPNGLDGSAYAGTMPKLEELGYVERRGGLWHITDLGWSALKVSHPEARRP